ncbi:uncharacterized protein LOC142645481 [Dermatophagoides pteronyssinus]|uniref:uncharacterized protein LOC142645481 n=1 Tax=Dermatophagoides pteronyssinus TaxID=6956 RepID=UPI003F66848B
MKIKNFSLRLFVNYSSFIGLTFDEMRLKKNCWPQLIKFLSLLMVHIYAYILFRDYQNNNEGMNAKELSQNHFGTLIDLVSENFFPLAFIFSYIFYYRIGYSLIRSCDSKLFQTIYDDTSRKSQIISIIILILINISIILNYAGYGFWSLQTEYPFEMIIKFYSMTMILYSQIFNNVLCIYFKFAIRQLLQQTLQNFIGKKINDNQCLRIIRTLAKQCNNFHSSMAFFIIMNILKDCFYLLCSFIYVYLDKFSIIQFIILIIHFGLFVYWIYLDYDAKKILSNLFHQIQHQYQCKSMRQQQQQQQSSSSLKVKNIKQLIQSIDNDDDRLIAEIDKYLYLNNNYGSRKELLLIEMDELYSEDYHFELFNLYRLDQNFLIDFLAFTILYFVLIIQTA